MTVGSVGVIGAGAMGLGVVRSLRRAGRTTVVRDIDARAVQHAAALGARIAPSPAALAREVDLVIVLVVDAAQVDDVLFGADGAAAALAPGGIVVLSSTVAPSFVVSVGARLPAGVHLVDAPVSGGPQRAHDAALTVMAGGTVPALARCAPVFAQVASRVFEVGDAGDGARMKLVNNLLAAANLAAAAEAFALARRAGLDVRKVHEIVAASSGASWIESDRMPRALAGDLAARAAARILAKDVTLAAELARSHALDTPFADAARSAFRAVLDAGHGEDDDAVILALAAGLPSR
jgi:3-hydroxyisobutyrate dehydrogenase